MRSPEFAAYFLARLENPLWIAPLRENGIFASPPPIVRAEGGSIQYAGWPATRYLARMAAIAPREVADVLVGIETENPSVLNDVLDAARKMPALMATRLVPVLSNAIKGSWLSEHFSKATDFCEYLAVERETDAAVTLAEAMFFPQFEQGHEEPSRRDRYWYMKGLKRLVPHLAAHAPDRFLPCLCDWLTALITAKDHTDQDAGLDYSDIWRPAIEEHEQNRTYDFAGEIVGFVRQAFEEAIRSEHISLDAGLAIINDYRYVVFARLRIHLINHFADRVPELARAAIMNRSFFDKHEFKHEYAIFLGHRFPMLLPEEQRTWLGWVEAGPDMSGFDESFKTMTGRDPTEADRRAAIRRWQFHRLHWIRDHLMGEQLRAFQEMSHEYTDTRLADFNAYHGPVRVGYESPFTAESFRDLSFSDVVDKVTKWRRDPGQVYHDGPQVEGLAGTFAEYISGKREALSNEAGILKDCPPIYVRTFVEQMADGIKAGEAINLGAVLRLCDWVVSQRSSNMIATDEQWRVLGDQGWQWTREAICRLVREICEASSEETPRYSLADHREAMRALLESLGHDPAKSYVVDEAKRENLRAYDFVTAAINSPRGKAVDALLAYARWIANHTKRDKDGREYVPDGLKGMPEVSAMLEWQIAPEHQSFESFATIGAHVGLLCWIDKPWLEANASQIFDLSGIEREPTRAYGWAAWNAFLVWGKPHISYYQMLRQQYAYAVENISGVELPSNAGSTPLHHLGEQLVILYGRGDLAIYGDEELLYRFLQVASSDIRSQTIAFVGRSLHGDKNVPTAVLERFRKLWDWYWPEWGRKDVKARPESGLFAAWFICSLFPVEWRLERLESLLTLLPMPEDAGEIVEHLAEIADTHTEVATRVLDGIIRADREGWRAYEWREPARKILATALRSDEAVRRTARQLVDDLGRRGFVEYGELLGAPVAS